MRTLCHFSDIPDYHWLVLVGFDVIYLIVTSTVASLIDNCNI